MKDTLLGELLAVVISVTGMIIALVRVNRNSIRRSIETATRTAEHRTEVDLSIVGINKDLLQMKEDRIKYQSQLSTILSKMEGDRKEALCSLKVDNEKQHSALFKINQEQTKAIVEVAKGVAEINGYIKAKEL